MKRLWFPVQEVWVQGLLGTLPWNSAEGTCHRKSTQEANYSVGQEVEWLRDWGSSSLSRAKHQKASYTPISQRLPQLPIILSWGENLHMDLWGIQIIQIRFHSCWPANPMDSETDPTPASYFILQCLHCWHSLHCAFCYTQLQTSKQTKILISTCSCLRMMQGYQS